jgi:hypothetical protein
MEEAVRLTAAVGHLDILCRSLNSLAEMSHVAGELALTRFYTDRAMRAAEQMSNPRLICHTRIVRGESAFVAGKWSEARMNYEQAAALGNGIDLYFVSAYVPLGLARLAHALGASADTRHYLEQTVATAERVSNLLTRDAAELLLAEVEILEGKAEAARGRLARLLDRTELRPRDIIAAQATFAWAQLEMGEVALVEAVAEQASSRARVAHYNIILVDALRVQAMVLTRQARWEAASDVVAEALALARGIPSPYAEGRLLQVSGHMRVAQGETELARERLEAALTIFRRLGACKDATRTEQLLAALG